MGKERGSEERRLPKRQNAPVAEGAATTSRLTKNSKIKHQRRDRVLITFLLTIVYIGGGRIAGESVEFKSGKRARHVKKRETKRKDT